MTETAWNTCDDPEKMLDFVCPKTSNRKLWLLTAANCRDGFCYLPVEICKKIREIGERLADGLASVDELQRAWNTFWKWQLRLVMEQEFERAACLRALRQVLDDGKVSPLGDENLATFDERLRNALDGTEHRAHRAVQWIRSKVEMSVWSIRELFGPTLFSPNLLDPSFLRWHDGFVRKLAEGIYQDRGFGQLPILADALEDAGCTNTGFLSHLRSPAPHALGCWALDRILEKE